MNEEVKHLVQVVDKGKEFTIFPISSNLGSVRTLGLGTTCVVSEAISERRSNSMISCCDGIRCFYHSLEEDVTVV